MKIHPRRHGVSFHPSLSSFSFSVPLKGEIIAKEGVDKLTPSVYFVTQETHDTISYVPELIYNLDKDFDVFRMYFGIIQLVCHVNHLVNKRL